MNGHEVFDCSDYVSSILMRESLKHACRWLVFVPPVQVLQVHVRTTTDEQIGNSNVVLRACPASDPQSTIRHDLLLTAIDFKRICGS